MKLVWLFLALSVHADDDDESKVLTLTKDNFDDALKENERVLLEFYAPWCGHCKALEPEYEAAAKEMAEEGMKTKLAKIDATVESELANRFGANGYPTLKYVVNNGDPQDYTGPRQKKGIINWLRSRELPALVKITEEEVQKKIDENNFQVIAKLKTGSTRYRVLKTAAEQIRDDEREGFNFAYIELPGTADVK